jgi:hypothetical protein
MVGGAFGGALVSQGATQHSPRLVSGAVAAQL